MPMKLSQAVVAVMACTLSAGFAGGVAGSLVGWMAPSFVAWLASPQAMPPPTFQPMQFAIGIGIVSGLFIGAGVGLFLVVLFVIRDMLQSWKASESSSKTHRDDFV